MGCKCWRRANGLENGLGGVKNGRFVLKTGGGVGRRVWGLEEVVSVWERALWLKKTLGDFKMWATPSHSISSWPVLHVNCCRLCSTSLLSVIRKCNRRGQLLWLKRSLVHIPMKVAICMNVIETWYDLRDDGRDKTVCEIVFHGFKNKVEFFWIWEKKEVV